MDFLIKLENLINSLIIKFQDLMLSLVSKLTPDSVKRRWLSLKSLVQFLISNFKNLPFILKTFTLKILTKIKEHLADYDFKTKLKESYAIAIERYKQNKPQKNLGKTKKFILSPFLLLGEWLSGLTTVQSLMLLSFTAASFLSIVSIFFEGHRLVGQHTEGSRSPASVNEVSYDRPVYYKQQNRFFEMNHLRLPVYAAQVNEIQSIDIDFVATMSNRSSKQKLEKLEMQLRDFLIFEIEPVTASFPLEEEGKEVIRQKLMLELNQFLKSYQIDGSVQELKIIYILAN